MSNVVMDAFKAGYLKAGKSEEEAERLAEIASEGFDKPAGTLFEAFRYFYLKEGKGEEEAERLAEFAAEAR